MRSLRRIERQLRLELPSEHRRCLTELDDPIHEACDFLVIDSAHQLLRIVDVNRQLHSPDGRDPWPSFLVALASNGCGDYFAYDTRHTPYPILYLDPDRTVGENLGASDALTFESFSAWRRDKLWRHAWVRSPHRRPSNSPKIDPPLTHPVRAVSLSLDPPAYAPEMPSRPALCVVCGAHAENPSALPASLHWVFEGGLAMGQSVLVHRSCVQACEALSEPPPIPG